jgi:UDP-glucose 4-epimerase
MVRAFERASGRAVAYRIAPRRPGDAAACYAHTSKAAEVLSWKAERGIDDMCTSTWRWQSGGKVDA